MRSDGTIVARRYFPSPTPHVVIEEVTYYVDGLRVKGLLASPVAKGRWGGLLYLRGGIQSIGTVRPARIAQFARRGFVVFAPFYRGNRGGEGRDAFVGADRNDAIVGIDVLKQQPNVWNDRLHVIGYSRGGAMACWVGIAREDIRSVTVWAGMSDIVATYKERVDMRRMMKRVIGGTPNRNVRAYRDRDPLSNVYRIEAPVHIIHGARDTNVSFGQACRLENELRAQSKQVYTTYLKRFDHFIPQMENRMLVGRVTRWMKRQEMK